MIGQAIRDAVREGRLSPEQGAELMALHYELVRIAWRRRFKAGLVDVLTLGPVRRWICRER